MLKIMQNFKFDFLENEFWADWGVCFKFHYREILELKMILAFCAKNGSSANKTCCALTALFVKRKIYFSRCNFEIPRWVNHSQCVLQLMMTYYVETPEMGVSILIDGVDKPFSVRPASDDDLLC